MAVTTIEKESYMLYRGWNPLFENLPKEQLGELFYAICCYQSGKEYEIKNPFVKGVFEMVLMQFQKDEASYKEKCEIKAKNGKKGAENRWQDNSKSQKDDSTDDSENGKCYSEDSKNGKYNSENGKNGKCYFSHTEKKSEMAKMAIEEKDEDEEEDEDEEKVEEVPTVPKKREARKRSATPSVDEVREYCFERGNGVDAETFVDFYASKGWKVGNAPMKDWKAAVRTWEKRDNRAAPRAKPIDTNDYLLGIIEGGSAS